MTVQNLFNIGCSVAIATVLSSLLCWLGVRGLYGGLRRRLSALEQDYDSFDERLKRRDKQDAGISSASSRKRNLLEAEQIALSSKSREDEAYLPGRSRRN